MRGALLNLILTLPLAPLINIFSFVFCSSFAAAQSPRDRTTLSLEAHQAPLLGIGRGTGYPARYRVYPAQVGVRVHFLNPVNTPTPSMGTVGIYGNYHTINATI